MTIGPSCYGSGELNSPDYSPDQVVRILRRRLTMHLSKPFPQDYRRLDDAQEQLTRELRQAFEALAAQGYRQEGIALGVLDESSPREACPYGQGVEL